MPSDRGWVRRFVADSLHAHEWQRLHMEQSRSALSQIFLQIFMAWCMTLLVCMQCPVHVTQSMSEASQMPSGPRLTRSRLIVEATTATLRSMMSCRPNIHLLPLMCLVRCLARTAGDAGGENAEGVDDDVLPPPPPTAPHPDEQLTAALHRIRGHLGSSRKFTKASALLRQLLGGGGLNRPAHGNAVFACLRAAMATPSHVGYRPFEVQQHCMQALQDPLAYLLYRSVRCGNRRGVSDLRDCQLLPGWSQHH